MGLGDTTGLEPGARSAALVRGATARICDEHGAHKGQGLVLAINEVVTVLTCHHVLADLAGGIYVGLPDGCGGFDPVVVATLDRDRSRPAGDTAVLHVAIDKAPTRPLLHALDPATYEGTLPDRATGYSHLATQTFDARVGAATRLDLPASDSGTSAAASRGYVIPHAFRLADSTDARPGVSGAVIAYESGVLGLAHFARAAGRRQERELYLVPLSAWAEGWEELEALIEPLVDKALRAAAVVRRVRDITVGMNDPIRSNDPDLVIAGYREEPYAERPEVPAARQALADGSLLIIGRPMSGKTRLAWELIRQLRDAVVVMPHDPTPPASFETSGLSGRQIILLCDDLHSVAERMQLMRWRDRLRAIASNLHVVVTARDGADWKRILDYQAPLLDAMGDRSRCLMSRTEDGGEDLPVEMAMELAGRLSLTEDTFHQRFDGTPGSLTLDLNGMRRRYERLREEQIGGVAASRLLDSLKLMHVGGQTMLDAQLARAVAECIRGDGVLATETWETLCQRTFDEGFGVFTPSGFRTYVPYLENCTSYEPADNELDLFLELLLDHDDWWRACAFGFRMAQRGHATRAMEAFNAVIGCGEPRPDALAKMGVAMVLGEEGNTDAARDALALVVDTQDPDLMPMAANDLAALLRERGDFDGARAAYAVAIDSEHPDEAPKATVGFANLLQEQGDLIGARRLFERALETKHSDAAPAAAVGLGDLLSANGDLDGAQAAYELALASGHTRSVASAAVGLGRVLTEQGDLVGASVAYCRAISANIPTVARLASLFLWHLVLVAPAQDQLVLRTTLQQAAAGSPHLDVMEIGRWLSASDTASA